MVGSGLEAGVHLGCSASSGEHSSFFLQAPSLGVISLLFSWLVILFAQDNHPNFFNGWHFELNVNFTWGFLQNEDFTVNVIQRPQKCPKATEL